MSFMAQKAERLGSALLSEVWYIQGCPVQTGERQAGEQLWERDLGLLVNSKAIESAMPWSQEGNPCPGRHQGGQARKGIVLLSSGLWEPHLEY